MNLKFRKTKTPTQRRFHIRIHCLYYLVLFAGITQCLNACITSKYPSKETSSVSSNLGSSNILNSERIKKKFGSYGINILQSDSTIRITDLYSVDRGIKTTRTVAFVFYPKDLNPSYAVEHNIIVNGGSIGQVFKKYDWKIEKMHLYFGEVPPTNELNMVYSLMGEIGPSELSIYIYQFVIKKHRIEHYYATIAEIYHPDYLNVEAIKGIYGSAFDNYSHKPSLVNDILEQVTYIMEIVNSK